jgi:glycosyltransferase involved in cell wall biosynthesis
VEHTSSIILLSGLPAEGKPSFFRQLECLASAWRREGRTVILGGPELPEPEILREARAVIALGYPDQFSFLNDQGAQNLPVFLWSQFSRIPRRVLPENPTYVPLTKKTHDILCSAGCSRIGPVIPHGVDSSLFIPLPPAERNRLRGQFDWNDDFVMGTVANNSLRKRFDLIIRSFSIFARDIPGSRLVIKTNRLVSLDGVDLPGLIAREHLEDRVQIVTEELNDPRLMELYNRLDLYLNLSEWEGFCIPVIEAMACGLPVVSLPIQGPAEILPYKDTLVPGSSIRREEGSVLYSADPRAVARTVLQLARESGRCRRLSEEGRAEVLSRYDIRRVAAQWDNLL